MHTAELYAGPEDGRTVTVPGPCRSEIRVPDSYVVRASLAMPLDDRPTAGTIPVHIYRWAGSRQQRAIYQYVRTD